MCRLAVFNIGRGLAIGETVRGASADGGDASAFSEAAGPMMSA